MLIVDCHTHFQGDDPQTVATLERLELKFLNNLVPERDRAHWRAPQPMYASLARDHPKRYAWLSGIELPDFDDAAWADRAIATIKEDLADGAVGVKFWKNIGMELRKPDGSFLMVDDAIYTPVFEWLAREGVTVLAHLAEPQACWAAEPVGYYKNHPEWWMGDKPDHPSHADIMAARDRVVASHPKLRFVGAHLGSLEYDVKEMAWRLDRWPNLALEVGGRFKHLAQQGARTVREFFSRYRDRLMLGTDKGLGQPASGLDEATRAEISAGLERQYTALREFHETSETAEHWGEKLEGLALPEDVLELYYYRNAQTWFPGV